MELNKAVPVEAIMDALVVESTVYISNPGIYTYFYVDTLFQQTHKEPSVECWSSQRVSGWLALHRLPIVLGGALDGGNNEWLLLKAVSWESRFLWHSQERGYEAVVYIFRK